MSGRNLFDREREALRELLRLVEWRVAAEAESAQTFEAEKAAANKEVARARRTVAADRERERQAVTNAWDDARRSIQEKFDAEKLAADRLRDFTVQEARDRAKAEEEKTRTAYSDALWTADSVYEAAEKEAEKRLDERKRAAAEGAERIKASWDAADPLLARGRLTRDDIAGTPPSRPPVDLDDPADRLEAALARADEALDQLRGLRSLRRVGPSGFVRWLLVFAVLAAVPAILIAENRVWIALGGAVFAAAAAGITHLIARGKTLRRSRELGVELAAALAEAGKDRDDLLALAADEHRAAIMEGARHRNGAKIKGQEKFPPLLAKLADRCRAEIDAAEDKHERDLERLGMWYRESLQKAEAHFAPMLRQCHEKYDRLLEEAERAFAGRRDHAVAERERSWDELVRSWAEGQDRLIDVFNRLRAAEVEHFLPWDAPFWKTFPPSERVPPGIRFGSVEVDLRALPGALPEDEDLAGALPPKMELPAFLPFPDRCTLVLKARDDGRVRAVQELQTLMLRFLTAVPAGKVRFTIIDPVGLGDNFAAFMHLADFDENLIGARIWTETAQIDKRLADVTAHMENVIQKYLRNQYKSIEEYNAKAGEVAEPFRVLVVANFPVNFSLEACRRLVSIAQSGATCGVYTLVSIDTRQPVPQGFNAADLEQGAITLVWKDDGFQWKDPELSRFPLSVEAPPPPDEVVRLVRVAGERGRDANRIEVPFDSVMPKGEKVWAGDSRSGIAVPIGRAGATKLQMFELGKGTAQHALVAGKTGSGKSTLLHAFVTNLALTYSPEQVELYLIDFKKGVEFKAYAENRLPHARVVAIESEREFGLSVLQRLDAVLRERGERFRDAGVNDLAGYRAFLEKRAPGNGDGNADDHPASCPRIVLVVDEFQEFFVEDDRVAQETALLLDRLVRQGRAFGLHVLLGSQTLGGAYSLARSTIDQMAVRIALQCSDADAQLILSKDNTAARLLSRPGEAIYNDANGLVEGNDLFQVVWLSDSRREQLLKQVRERAEERASYPPPLVFEGNAAADLAKNAPLEKLLNAWEWPAETRAASAWLGEAIAIKDPTAAVFRPHSGNHLLAIGQQEPAALAIFAASLVALAAQHPPATRFVVLDSTPEDDPNAGLLGRAAAALPHPVDFVDRGGVTEALAGLAALLSARQKSDAVDRAPRYVIVHGLHRYRELRKADDDFGFGRRGAERVASPAENFATLLRDGPAAGIHFLIWCDALTNLNRAVDRQLAREFGQRVLFQMSANDSSTLIDNPAASRLGRNRALYVTEEAPVPEKFRPYGPPTAEWLKTVKLRLERRAGG
jgi:S-DNA-T family DNA segregation ATPase FtsK/SpoIIIE